MQIQKIKEIEFKREINFLKSTLKEYKKKIILFLVH